MVCNKQQIEEFVLPPQTTVLTAKISNNFQKQLLASGDDKNNVCLWRFSNEHPLLTLHHGTFQNNNVMEISAVAFNYLETGIYAGSNRGIINLWDLNTQKAISLKGHTTSVSALEIFQSEEKQNVLCSGSLDLSVKVWDIRIKEFIHTFKGHTQHINCLATSPDGKWVASGGEDGQVRVWDLQQQRCYACIQVNESPITSIAFNPLAVALAVGGADRTVRYWDLQNNELLATSKPDTKPIRKLCFEEHLAANQQDVLFSAADESLRILNVNMNLEQMDQVESSWKGVLDLHIDYDQQLLYGLTMSKLQFGLWASSLKQLVHVAYNGNENNNILNNANNDSLNKMNTSLKAQRELFEQQIMAEQMNMQMNINNNALQQESINIQPLKQIKSQQQDLLNVTSANQKEFESKLNPFFEQYNQFAENQRVQKMQNGKQKVQHLNKANENIQQNENNQNNDDLLEQQEEEKIYDQINAFEDISENISDNDAKEHEQPIDCKQQKLPKTDAQQDIFISEDKINQQMLEIERMQQQCQNQTQGQPILLQQIQQIQTMQSMQPQPIQLQAQQAQQIQPSSIADKIIAQAQTQQQQQIKKAQTIINTTKVLSTSNDLACESIFIEGGLKELQLDSFRIPDQKSENKNQQIYSQQKESIKELTKEHNNLIDILNARLKYVQPVAQYWSANKTSSAVFAINSLSNASLIQDAIQICLQRSNGNSNNSNSKGSQFGMEAAAVFVQKSQVLIESKYQVHIKFGMSLLQKLLNMFQSDLISMLNTSIVQKVDLAREQRMVKYNQLARAFLTIHNLPRFTKIVEKYKTTPIGEQGRALLDSLGELFSKIKISNMPTDTHNI